MLTQSNIDLETVFNQRLDLVKRARKSSVDGKLFTLVIIVNRWSLPSYFEAIDKLLLTTSGNVLNGWQGNFTKVVLYTGNPKSSYILPHLSTMSNDGQCAAVMIEESSQMPHFLRLLKPLKTTGTLDDFIYQHNTASPKAKAKSVQGNVEGRYILDVYNNQVQLEKVIVDCTHCYCEFILLKELKAPISLTLSLTSQFGDLDVDTTPYIRVVIDKPTSTLSLRAAIRVA